jgi:transposase-like protein
MMPAAISEEIHEKAKVIAIQVGYREAARQLGINQNTLLSWARTEGWSKQIQVAENAVVRKNESQGVQSASLRSTSEVLLGMGDKSKLLAARVGHKTLKAINRPNPNLPKELQDKELISNAQPYSTTVTALAKVHGWGSEAPSGPLVNLNLLGLRPEDLREI